MSAHDQHPIEEQTFLVYRRYYFVARLDKTIQLLAKMYQEVSAMQAILGTKQIDLSLIVPEQMHRLFTHEKIRRSVKEIEHTRSLKPLFMEWESFKSYKSLHDELLVEDFSKEIFLITRNTIKTLTKGKLVDPLACPELSLNDRLNAINDYCETLQQLQDGFLPNKTTKTTSSSNVHLAVHTDEVAFRYYCIKRLDLAIQYLLACDEKTFSSIPVVLNRDGIVFKGVGFPVKKGLTHLWDNVLQYKHIENESYMHDFAAYLLLILKVKQSEQTKMRFSHADLVAMQHTIKQLPLEEILQTIDLLVKQMNSTIQHYNKSGLTFNQWIKKYWWAPSAVCLTVAIKCYILYYKTFRK